MHCQNAPAPWSVSSRAMRRNDRTWPMPHVRQCTSPRVSKIVDNVEAITGNLPRSEATACHVTRRKLRTPGNAEEHKRQETPTINPIGPTDKPHNAEVYRVGWSASVREACMMMLTSGAAVRASMYKLI